MTDYTDEPFGLPPGTYRPVEQRHTIIPHLEGYRFRPLVPEEQLRNRERNEEQASMRQEEGWAGFGSQSGGGGYPSAGKRPDFRFRPDSRLDAPTRNAPSRYAFPMGAEAPRFRSR